MRIKLSSSILNILKVIAPPSPVVIFLTEWKEYIEKSENNGVGMLLIRDPIECAASEIIIGLPIFFWKAVLGVNFF